MKKTIFHISKMDCPSEEQMIRIKLEGVDSIKQLDFDVSNQKLIVLHTDDVKAFDDSIYDLRLGATLLDTSAFEEELTTDGTNKNQTRVLWWVLAINFTFFILEMTYGWLSNSMGLIADSLDMLADTIVYGLSIMAVGAVSSRKKTVAKLSGYFQLALAGLGLFEVFRRFYGFETVPIFQTMIVVSSLALVANSISLWLILKAKSSEAHMQASVIFTSNDIVINAGVILAGLLVYFTSSIYPDLIIGSIIFLIVIRGAIRILKLAK